MELIRKDFKYIKGSRLKSRNTMNKIAVVAIGGNSLIKDECHQTISDQYEAICETCRHIPALIKFGYQIVITHGNGPQVGFILLRSEIAKGTVHPVPIDHADAETQGAIGYNIEKALINEFKIRKINKSCATVITQVVVSPDDPAFENPTKPIGPFYSEEEALKRKEEYDWDIVMDGERGWRRVVSSPRPYRIVELNAIKKLVEEGIIVIAAGGGGVPVLETLFGFRGVEAVIDKDYTSSLLARELNAELFLILTAVDKIYLNFGKPNQKGISKLSVADAEKYLKQGHFGEGSMAPKITAGIEFLKHGKGKVIITRPELIEQALEGKAGTIINL